VKAGVKAESLNRFSTARSPNIRTGIPPHNAQATRPNASQRLNLHRKNEALHHFFTAPSGAPFLFPQAPLNRCFSATTIFFGDGDCIRLWQSFWFPNGGEPYYFKFHQQRSIPSLIFIHRMSGRANLCLRAYFAHSVTNNPWRSVSLP